MNETLRIVQLYADELGITGDRGNVLALLARWERAGSNAEHVLIGRGDEIPADADVVVMGNGPLSAMRLVMPDLREKAAHLEGLVAQGTPLLAVGGGAELLGESVETLDGETLTGVGVFPFRVRRVRDRRVGYVVADAEHGHLVGFEDHASEWTLGDGAVAYGAVTGGKGSFARTRGRGEGVRRGHAYATNVQGPVLP
ncbi:glutamine amidotransferase, partial [Microbacterium sp. CPCC 204701]|uniref:glutamine amidotransferase n=1 Tax=Microbacterium sp. CPCC 204701 TaxID=2493084 RepID=UPI000FDBB219